MAAHYHVGILPTQARKPKEKAGVDAGAFRRVCILGRLRSVAFFCLAG
jgi:hypothetical protein